MSKFSTPSSTEYEGHEFEVLSYRDLTNRLRYYANVDDGAHQTKGKSTEDEAINDARSLIDSLNSLI
jgi:hypothetical protein